MSARQPAATWHPLSIFGSATNKRIFWGGVVVYLIWSLTTIDIDFNRALSGLPRAWDILARMFPPDFSRWEILLEGMLESIQIAVVATVAGVALSIPLGICAARNLVPIPVYALSRSLIVLGRTFHELIIAIFFVKLFGFGAVAGLLTLTLTSTIFLGKILAEDIENIKEGPVEALRSTGAGFWKVVYYAVIPQVAMKTLGVIIYRFDSNLRHSTVIGIVGAGGIGQSLSASFSRYEFDFSCAILIVIALMVALCEWFSDWIRRRLR